MSKVVNFRVRIKEDLETMEAFQRFVLRKEGKLHGAWGREIVRACAYYMTSAEHDRMHTNPLKNVGIIRLKRIAAVYNALPNGSPFPKAVVEALIESEAQITGRITKSDYFNFMLGWSLVCEVKTRGKPKFEKGRMPGWMKESLEGS